MDKQYIFATIIFLSSFPIFYYYILMLGGGFQYFFNYRKSAIAFKARHRFFIAIPAHNEQAVISKSLEALARLDYPKDLYDIFVVADYCTDQTANLARAKGARTIERKDGPAGNKSKALSYLFDRFLNDSYDAVVIFDADTLVHKDFLSRMNDQLCGGSNVIQGNQKVYNYMSGGFPALAEASYLINNLFENAGRNAFGLSAKLSGDCVCIRRSIIEQFGFGDGLAEDQYIRHVLIRNGYKVEFEPLALGWGQAPISWKSAKEQRDRWFQGNLDCDREHFRKNILSFLKSPSLTKIDNFIEMILPKYTSYAFFVALFTSVSLFFLYKIQLLSTPLLFSLVLLFALTTAFPIFCLYFSKAPFRVYRGLILGPYYILWRFDVLFRLLSSGRRVKWVRTQRESV